MNSQPEIPVRNKDKGKGGKASRRHDTKSERYFKIYTTQDAPPLRTKQGKRRDKGAD